MNQNILIVADESVQTQGLLRGLGGVSLPAHLLPDARSTLALLKNWCPAVVVIDKALPDLSGLDLCRIIKSESRTPINFCFATSG
jgi:DNA-binding response OmpR family regulator